MYAGAPLSLGAFRRRLPDADRPYRLPAARDPVAARVRRLRPDHPVVRAGTPIWKLGVAILIGYVILVANRRLPPQPAQAARWTGGPRPGCRPTWSAWALIVYFSAFGPMDDPALIRFGWDMLVVAVCSACHLLLGDGGRAAEGGDRGDDRGGRAARGGGHAAPTPLTAGPRWGGRRCPGASLYRASGRRPASAAHLSAWWRSRPRRRGRPSPRRR